MKKLSKILSCIAASVLSFAVMGITAFADEFSFDMEKAKQTQGGGQAFVSFTRLDNERRDRLKFNPLWITPESTVEVDYKSEGEYGDQPMNLILQSWVGALVDSTEDKWIQIPPTVYDETHAVWSYDTITGIYGDDFSDVYAILIEDNGTNSLLVTSITITNLSVPEDERENIAGGILTVTGIAEDVAEATVAGKIEVTDDEQADAETTESVSSATTAKKDSSESTQMTESDTGVITSAVSIPLYLIIITGVLVIALIVITIRAVTRRKNHGWR